MFTYINWSIPYCSILKILSNLIIFLLFLPRTPTSHTLPHTQKQLGFLYDAQFVRSRRFNKIDLLFDGYLYSKVCQTNRSTFWRCRQARANAYKCKSRAVTREIDGIHKVKMSQSCGHHNHTALTAAVLNRLQYVDYVSIPNNTTEIEFITTVKSPTKDDEILGWTNDMDHQF